MGLDVQKLLAELPEALKANPALRYELFRVLSENFSSREETNQLLRELRELRKESAREFREMRERFARMDERFEALQRETNERFEALQRETNERFEALQRETNERFAALQREMNERFAALQREMDERFASVDERFIKVDARFDQIERKMERGFAEVREEMQDIAKRVDLQVGRFLTRAGHHMEDLVAATLRVALQDRDIREDSLRLRQKFVDREGLVRPKGREVECDLLVRDGRLLVFEIKAYAEVEDVENLADKVRLVQTHHPDVEVVGVLVVLAAERAIERACRRHGIVLAR